MAKANGFTRREIMNTIKIQGPMTADDLAARLGISSVAVRQHVGALEAEGYVETAVERRGLGRPVHRYGLTPSGDETFPRNYDKLALSILDEVRTLYGDEGVEALLTARRKRLAAALSARLDGLPARERVIELVDAQNSTGYMTSCAEVDGDVVLREHNCPICRISKNYPTACREELEMFRDVLGPQCSVEREETIASGGRSCAYRIRFTENN
jgi:predicted ArsR family transcriptional regulator